MRRWLALTATLALITSCGRRAKDDGAVLVGAGATLPYPVFATWAARYAEVEPSVRLHYQPVGSAAGLRQLRDGVIDFGATDAPELPDGPPSARAAALVPATASAVVLAYHLSGEGELTLTAANAADVLLGRIARWNDPKLVADNPGVELPDTPIVVVARSDASASSAALTGWLSTASRDFEAKVGHTAWPRFPVGASARGNEGVTAFLKATPGTLGYVELSYAKNAHLRTALLENRAGARVAPDSAGVTHAIASAPASAALYLATDPRAYPLAAVSYFVLPQDGDRRKDEVLRRFAWWAIHEGQTIAEDLDYVRLPATLVARGEETLEQVSRSSAGRGG